MPETELCCGGFAQDIRLISPWKYVHPKTLDFILLGHFSIGQQPFLLLDIRDLAEDHRVSSLTSLLCSGPTDRREDPLQGHSCPGALHFSSQGYFCPPQLSVGVRGPGGAHAHGKEDLQGDFDGAWAAWHLSIGLGPPSVPPPHCCLAERAWGKSMGGGSCWAPRGDLTPLHVQERPSGPWAGNSGYPLLPD